MNFVDYLASVWLLMVQIIFINHTLGLCKIFSAEYSMYPSAVCL